VLGLGCGQKRGSAEILLKSALMAAEETGATVELVRLDDLRIPSGPDAADADDIWWFWERLIACDALVLSTPIITRTIAARLKLLGDRLLGPNADAAIIKELLRIRAAGGAPKVPFRVDERVLKPRVAGFIAVGGSLTSQWKALTLPMMHGFTLSMQIAVVDQVMFSGAGTPRSIVLDDAALARARRLGRNVAGQIGRNFEAVEYKGDDAGLCPMCHLDVVTLRGRDVECATCGARGALVVSGGDVSVRFSAETCLTSVISMHEKRAHFFEIQDTARRHAARREDIERSAAAFDDYDRLVLP
jgi:multimeric flavodoxin WrbA